MSCMYVGTYVGMYLPMHACIHIFIISIIWCLFLCIHKYINRFVELFGYSINITNKRSIFSVRRCQVSVLGGAFHSHGGTPIAGWFMMENPLDWMIWRYHHFWKPPCLFSGWYRCHTWTIFRSGTSQGFVICRIGSVQPPSSATTSSTRWLWLFLLLLLLIFFLVVIMIW